MKKFLTLGLLVQLSLIISGQVAPDKYWVRFTDKNNSPFSVDNPQQFLSQKAIDRRNAQGILIVWNDLPVNPAYVQAVASTGATILNVSKWMNSVTIYTTSSSVLDAIDQLSFVLSVDKSNSSGNIGSEKSEKPFFDHETYDQASENEAPKDIKSGQSYSYGNAYNQINMLNGIPLHDLGFNGTGMTITVLDAGFLNANTIPAFSYLWTNNRILGTKDFVSPSNPNIFGSHTHGTNVLSTMGANIPGQMVGTAPEASYWLLRSEDGGSEYLIEELNWVSAAEYADSVGADVINSSLGYTTFDDPSQNHTYEDMDGNSTPVSIGADIAVSKGMIVVNSAGNEGSSSWYYIGAPADGDSVFSIGAVTASGNYASFSSHGPTYDGQMKPDVVAQGSGTAIINATTGNVTTGSGTSFSSPVTAGMVTCLWQAHPNRRNTQILEAIQQSGSLANNPNYQLGYGIPNYMTAHNLLSLPVTYNFSLEIKVFLEGAFNGSGMNADLNSILPLSQPYNVAPFNYGGTESVTSIPSSDIVDWVLVELRDAASPVLANNATVIARKASFLKSDGSLVGLDGISNLQFNVTANNQVFLTVWHRNHLSILSFYPLIIHNGIASYDFSTGSVKTFGAANGCKELGNGIWGMISGNGNADATINDLDKLTEWQIDAGEQGYIFSDYNLDGQVSNPDKDNYWLPNVGISSQVP
jgi:serine protease AprX